MLQHRIRIFAETLAPTGLKPNAAKCHSLTIKVDGKHKKTVVDNNAKYTIAGQPIPTMGPTDSIKYLGVEISASGVLMSAGKRLHKQLTETDRAPLKPQQRLFILKRHIIPGMTHTLVLGKTNITKLKAMDITIRTMTRKWLHIPKDTPVGFFHAALEDGGLDIPALVDTIPRLVKNRLAKLNDSDHPNIKLVTQSGYLSHRGGVASGAMTADENRRKRAQQLLSSVDGRGLHAAKNCPASNRWIDQGHWQYESLTEAPAVSKEDQEAFWGRLFSTPSTPDARPVVPVRDPQWAMLNPISVDEVSNCLKDMSAELAAGPDKLTVRQLRSCPRSTLARLFNLWLYTSCVPEALKHARTTLIPKAPEVSTPDRFRPITISSASPLGKHLAAIPDTNRDPPPLGQQHLAAIPDTTRDPPPLGQQHLAAVPDTNRDPPPLGQQHLAAVPDTTRDPPPLGQQHLVAVPDTTRDPPPLGQQHLAAVPDTTRDPPPLGQQHLVAVPDTTRDPPPLGQQHLAAVSDTTRDPPPLGQQHLYVVLDTTRDPPPLGQQHLAAIPDTTRDPPPLGQQHLYVVLDTTRDPPPLGQQHLAFITADGTAENVTLLEATIKASIQQRQPLAIAWLDIAKAFDSVSHDSILRGAERAGLPPPAVAIIKDLYQDASTEIRRGAYIQTKRGVRQGEPWSPWIFNAVVDEATSPTISSASADDVPPVMAFADDLVVMARTSTMLEHRVNSIADAILCAGLSIHPEKCWTSVARVDGRKKIRFVDSQVRIMRTSGARQTLAI
ncbi:Retrovirus-related Pol polyprotein from type-1 retrotransposable element R2 [Amphibalanus amphitrite]|uniref:Retrovirus-related Pol polyprotein from type-1 retrotransposable element R2 n=1 Tax=Amphibalanus amphitrite TaxID=1232801 RepID=A0A6A4WKT1_AMPAM|nr:Retrovirus-related Pol polyprotein from type-1 retrotransposable element R2 [Amphibalanus amphitrite]